ncbi:hypothetical protein RhiirC2_91760 [Rhizophagus irregularis]|uniref:Uncharacterized protein n=1 Tax=Rhizophagus irregularis TaxID=588596 RepID=A0A2N1MSY0_9GLOM|nr:hypothetical protein RhiirC2_91760 [Rhizophagus irregularis]
MQRSGNEVSRGTTINNLNRVENNSRLANPRKRSIEVENCSSIANPQKRARVENQNNRSTTHNLVQGGSTKINIRAATNRGNDSRTADPQHSRKLVNSLLPAEFDRFSTQALNKKVKNKDLTKSEWENIRLIKAALINLVESSQKYNRIEAGKLVWSKINEWVYNTFYPDLNKYLDKKRINRENADLVIKAIMDYYVSRHDRYNRRIRKTE